MVQSLVDDEPAGEAPDLPHVDEEMERELMGREEVPLPVAIEIPAPDEPTSEVRRHRGLTHLPYQPWCNVCGREKQTWGTITDHCILKTDEDEPMITVLVATDTVCTQMIANPLEKRATEIHSQVAVWPHSHDTSEIPKLSSKETRSTHEWQSFTTHAYHCHPRHHAPHPSPVKAQKGV